MNEHCTLERGLLDITNRAKLLKEAIEAVEAGADVTVAEAELVLTLIDSPGVVRRYDGGYYYSDDPDCKPFVLNGTIIPEAVRSSAIRVLRKAKAEAEAVKARAKNKGGRPGTNYLLLEIELLTAIIQHGPTKFVQYGMQAYDLKNGTGLSVKTPKVRELIKKIRTDWDTQPGGKKWAETQLNRLNSK